MGYEPELKGMTMNILLQNFRCFSGSKYAIPINPLTIIVGENSTGKSAFIASIAALSDVTKFPLNPGFNSPPFELGSYETIASRRLSGKNASSFTIGFEETDKASGKHTKLSATYIDKLGHVLFSHLNLDSDVGQLKVYLDKNNLSLNVVIPVKKGKKKIIFKVGASGPIPEGFQNDLRSFMAMKVLPAVFKSMQEKTPKGKKFKEKVVDVVFEKLTMLFDRMIVGEMKALAIAPIRTRPQRTYDTFADDFDPEGGHIPLRLARILESRGSKKVKRIKAALKKFGDESGLYKGVNIKKGRSGSAFQIIVQIGQQKMNLMDVGYGVSQSLPIIVQGVLGSSKQMILLQQPEVHLHPKAQAALGTFFLDLASNESKKFIIETHSEYLIDRIRREVANKKINPDTVGILHFEKSGTHNKVYPIKLDKNGNIKGAPASYREFFLDEEMKLLSRGRK